MVMSFFSNRRAKKRAAAHQRHLADQQNARAQGAYNRATQHADWTRGLAGAQVGAILGRDAGMAGAPQIRNPNYRPAVMGTRETGDWTTRRVPIMEEYSGGQRVQGYRNERIPVMESFVKEKAQGKEFIADPNYQALTSGMPNTGLLSMFIGPNGGAGRIEDLYQRQMRSLGTLPDLAGRGGTGQLGMARNATNRHFEAAESLAGYADTLDNNARGFLDKANAYNTDQHRNYLASQAAADAAMAFGTTQGMMERRRAAMGLGPGGYDSLSAMNLAATRANMMNRTRHQAEAEGFRRYAQAIQAGQGLLGQAGSLLGRSSDAARMGMAGLAGEQQLQALPLHSFLTSSNMNLGGAAAALNVLNRAGGLAGSGIAGVNAAVTGTGNAANMSAAAAQAQANVPTAFQELREVMAGISEMYSAAKGIPTG